MEACPSSCVSRTSLLSSDGLQKLQHAVFSPLLARPRLLEYLTVRESLCLHLQVDLGVNIGGVDRDMPKPIADRVHVDSRFQQMHSRSMSNRVRTDPFARKRRSRCTCFRHIPPDQREDSETGNRLSTAVPEDALMGSTSGNQWRQCIYCKRPQRTPAYLPSLSHDPDTRLGAVQTKVVDEEARDFVSAGAGVVHEEQQGIVPCPLIGVPICALSRASISCLVIYSLCDSSVFLNGIPRISLHQARCSALLLPMKRTQARMAANRWFA